MTKNQLHTLQKILTKHKLDAFFVSSIPTITYLTHFSGFDNEDRNAFLLITRQTQYIFTHGIYKEAAQKYMSDFTLIDITREQPMSSSLQQLMEKHTIQKLGFEADDMTYLEYLSLTKKIDKNILFPADEITENIRTEKSIDEIRAIRQACQLGDKAFAFLLTKIKEDITEKDLALEYELFVKKQGANISFATIVAFGSNGSLPHHIPTNKKLTKNNFIVLDFGVKLNNYCSDMTRTIFFGKANTKQKKIYETVLEAQKKSIDYIASRCHAELAMPPEVMVSESNEIPKPSKGGHKQVRDDILGSEVDKVARDYIINQGYPDMPHSLGHGIGLLVHEQPRLTPYSKDILSPGMVFSIEPGIYIPNYSGVRIEDLVTITNKGLEVLTNAPKTLIEL